MWLYIQITVSTFLTFQYWMANKSKSFSKKHHLFQISAIRSDVEDFHRRQKLDHRSNYQVEHQGENFDIDILMS
jgi:hypothetical protein